MRLVNLPLAAAMLVVAAMPVSGCAFGGCDDIGCSNLIRFEVAGLPYPKTDTPFKVTACFDDNCKTLRATQRGDSLFAESGSGTGLILVFRRSASAPTEISFHLQNEKIEGEAEHDVSLRMKVGDRPSLTFEDQITMEGTTPENACGDLQCWGAEIEVPNQD